MIVYEISTEVQKDLINKFERFMRTKHIPDLLKTGYFVSGEMNERSKGNYVVRYLARDRETLEKYFEKDAARLREDFIENFPTGIEVTRNIYEE